MSREYIPGETPGETPENVYKEESSITKILQAVYDYNLKPQLQKEMNTCMEKVIKYINNKEKWVFNKDYYGKYNIPDMSWYIDIYRNDFPNLNNKICQLIANKLKIHLVWEGINDNTSSSRRDKYVYTFAFNVKE